MMKQIFTLFILVCLVYFAEAQNVCIGTITPAGKLHVKGGADTSQLMIDANTIQTNLHPLIKLRTADGTDLMHIHSDNTANIFMGVNAGVLNNAAAGGLNNTFIGNHSGAANISGQGNTTHGAEALSHN